ncbi:hypothetical protein TcG_08863 [Trypanosoma cruzi]|nr:hypothetical protein TcG_08863 [Trypanosoma cruzi]
MGNWASRGKCGRATAWRVEMWSPNIAVRGPVGRRTASGRAARHASSHQDIRLMRYCSYAIVGSASSGGGLVPPRRLRIPRVLLCVKACLPFLEVASEDSQVEFALP